MALLITDSIKNSFLVNDNYTISMHDDYYQNILYPLQDKVLNIVAELPVGLYLREEQL